MQVHWIVSILSILVALGLFMMIRAQYDVVDKLNKRTEMLKEKSERLNNEYQTKDHFKVSLEKVVALGQKVVADLEAGINKLGPEVELKKTENETCQAEMKTAKEQLEHMLQTCTETKASLEAEVKAWNQEIKTLKATLTGYNPICDYVKNTLTVKLCGTNTSLSEE